MNSSKSLTLAIMLGAIASMVIAGAAAATVNADINNPRNVRIDDSKVVINIGSGKDGKAGVDGKDGADGTNGIDGQNGRDGVNGTNGIDGRDGEDATATVLINSTSGQQTMCTVSPPSLVNCVEVQVDGNTTIPPVDNGTVIVPPVDNQTGNGTNGNVTEPTNGNVTEPTNGNVTEPTNGNVTEPTNGNVTEPVGNVTEPIGNVTEPVGNTTIPIGNITDGTVVVDNGTDGTVVVDNGTDTEPENGGFVPEFLIPFANQFSLSN